MAGIKFPSLEKNVVPRLVSSTETAALEPVPREGIGVETAALELVSSLETAVASLVPECKEPSKIPIVSSKRKEKVQLPGLEKMRFPGKMKRLRSKVKKLLPGRKVKIRILRRKWFPGWKVRI